MEQTTLTGRVRKKPQKLFQGVTLDDGHPILKMRNKKKKMGEKRKSEENGLGNAGSVAIAAKK